MDAVTLAMARGDTKRKLFAPAELWAIGDSITSAGYTAPTGDDGPVFRPKSYLAWACLLSMGSLRFGGIAATAGYTTTQMVATHLPTVLAARPRACLVLGGTNDGSSNFTTTVAKLTTIYQSLVGVGTVPVLCTLTPRNDALTTQSTWLVKINRWIVQQARENDWPLVDMWAAVVDPATSGWTSGLNDDDVHPNAAGAKAMGQAVSDRLATTLGRPIDLAVRPTANHWPTNLTNAQATNSLHLTDTDVDGKPDGWTDVSGSATHSLDAMTADEGSGNWWTIAADAGGYSARSTSGITLVEGNLIQYGMRVKTSGVVSGGGKFHIRLTTNTADNDVCSWRDWTQDADGYFLAQATVPSGMSTYNCQFRVTTDTAALTLKVGEVLLEDLTANAST